MSMYHKKNSLLCDFATFNEKRQIFIDYYLSFVNKTKKIKSQLINSLSIKDILKYIYIYTIENFY